MRYIDVRTQSELDDALQQAGVMPRCVGAGEFVVSGSSQVTAYGSSQVTAYGSSQVTAYDSSQVTAYGSSQVRAYDSSQVTAYDSSQVTAYDSSQVRAYDSSQVTASNFVAVTKQAGHTGKIKGGVVIKIPAIKTAEAWCEFYGVEVTRGVATLYKAVRDDYRSGHGFLYTPGTTPSAPDWDAEPECGSGLHFCARPIDALGFDHSATRFVACLVLVKDIVVHHPAIYPQKVKAPRVAKPIFEVDIHGQPIAVGKS